MKRSERRQKMAARALAILLVLAMLLMSGVYILSAIGAADAAFVVYGAELTEEERIAGKMDVLGQLILYIRDHYKDTVDPDALADSAFEGVFDSLDKWSVFFPDDPNAESFISSIENKYSGIGVTLSMIDGKCTVVSTHALGPAFGAGMKPGDLITEVDGQTTEGLTLEQITSKMRGEEGTTVRVTFKDAEGKETASDIVRTALSAQSVNGFMIEDGIGYIEISSFTSTTYREFNIVRLTLLAQGMTGMVIDLRDNGGGLMSGALNIADALMPAGIITAFEQQGEIVDTYYSTDNKTSKVPTAVLINGNTASASECLAAALQDSGAAVLVGSTTYGKGCAQVVANAGDEGSFKLSNYYFLRPSGEKIEGCGVSPDYEVYNSAKLSAEKLAELKKDLLPLSEERKYYAGQIGLNVLAAQQRLIAMGYRLTKNALMDEATVEALKSIQSRYGACPYGGLDYCTLELVERAFNEFVSGDGTDYQLLKAIEVVK